MSGPSPASRPCSDANSRRWSELRATACWRSDCSSPVGGLLAAGRGAPPGSCRRSSTCSSRPRHSSRSGGGVGVPRAALRRREGELAVIRTYPVRVSEYVAGVLLARTVALVAVVGVPYAVVGAGVWLTVAPDTGIFATHAGIDSPVLYLRFLAFVLLLGAAYVSLAAAVSALAASRRSAIALGVLALVAGVLGGDLLLLPLARRWGIASDDLRIARAGAERGVSRARLRTRDRRRLRAGGWVRLDEPRGRIAGRLGASRRWPRGRWRWRTPPRRRASRTRPEQNRRAERARELDSRRSVRGRVVAHRSRGVGVHRVEDDRGDQEVEAVFEEVMDRHGHDAEGRCPRPRSIG